MKRLSLLALALLQLACAPDFGGLHIDLVAGPAEAQVDADAVIVPAGSVVAFEATPIPLQDRREYDEDDELVLSSTDEDIALVAPGSRDDLWTVLGIAEGETELEVRINGSVESRIPLIVEAGS